MITDAQAEALGKRMAVDHLRGLMRGKLFLAPAVYDAAKANGLDVSAYIRDKPFRPSR